MISDWLTGRDSQQMKSIIRLGELSRVRIGERIREENWSKVTSRVE